MGNPNKTFKRSEEIDNYEQYNSLLAGGEDISLDIIQTHDSVVLVDSRDDSVVFRFNDMGELSDFLDVVDRGAIERRERGLS
jgi:hypothetical protein